jgi:hypothetical protein
VVSYLYHSTGIPFKIAYELQFYEKRQIKLESFISCLDKCKLW